MKLIKKIIQMIVPPPKWRFTVIILLGIAVGLGSYIIYISRAYSYLSNDPEACINCHVMTPEYATWERGSHGKVTVCNDCHVPHDNIFNKFLFKAADGMRHSYMFTLRLEPQVIQIKSAGKSVVQENCKRCHNDFVETVNIGRLDFADNEHGKGHLCWDCHNDVPHGKVHSLASTPFVRVAGKNANIPEWLNKELNKKK